VVLLTTITAGDSTGLVDAGRLSKLSLGLTCGYDEWVLGSLDAPMI
jgi:hypothetical protein